MAGRRAYIFGAGGHARVVSSLLDPAVDIRFVVPAAPADNQITEVDFFARSAEVAQSPVYLGIGSNQVRAAVLARLAAHGMTPRPCVAATASVARGVEIGPGAVICPGAVVNIGARIGLGAIVNTLAGIDHDCVLGNLTQIAPGVSLGGGVVIGRNGFLGIKSAVFPNIKIGDDVQVRAGSLVTRDVPDAVQVGGSPARILKKL